MTPEERAELEHLAQILERRQGYTYRNYFPDTGPLRRELYPRSLLFWAAGKHARERMFLAANRVGKTVTAAFEMTAHATGDYRPWWPGRVFDRATAWWCAGDTRETTRDIIQYELFGPREGIRAGTYAGMVPAHLVLDRTLKSGIADALDTVWIRYGAEPVHGGPVASTIQFKSYDQGRISFQGTSLSGGIWLDEEPPETTDMRAPSGATASGGNDIYTECLLRTATTNGVLIVTLTPLRGLTPFLEQFLDTAEMATEEGETVNAKLGVFGEAIQ